MANFNTHLSVGFIVTSFTAIIGYKAGLLNNHTLVVCTILGTMGGLLPDIDSKHSTPTKIFFNLISTFAAFSLMMFLRDELALLYLMILWSIGFVSIRFLAFEIFINLTVHRGVIHSVPYMAMLSLALTCFAYHYIGISSLNSWLYGMFLFIGAMVHLLLDEFYSVDLMGMNLKRSFGTAFKFYNKKSAPNFAIIYILLTLLIIFSPPFSDFWLAITDKQMWSLLQQSIIHNPKQ